MADIVAVLVVPADGDPGGLVARGVLGASPATYARVSCRAGHESWNRGVCDHPECRQAQGGLGLLRVLEVETALVLCWDGALVPEGWDRYVRSVPHEGYDARWPALAEVLVYAGYAERERLGRVVRLARVDGRLVEVGS